MKFKFSEILGFCILLITVPSIVQWSKFPFLGITFFWGIIQIIILVLLVKLKKKYFNPFDDKVILIVKLYLIWNVICIIRGGFVADNYWEWKTLVQISMVLLLPLFINIATSKIMVQNIFRVWIKYAVPAFVLFIPFIFSDGFGSYLAPMLLLSLWFPLLPKKWKFIAVILTVFTILVGQTARSNIIKFTVALLFGFVYYFRVFIPIITYKIGRVFLLIAPLLLFVLAITGVFNIFNIEDYVEGAYKSVEVIDGKRKETTAVADTRTFLYSEVLISAIKHNYVLFGRTPARGNDSNLFGLHQLRELKTGKKERYANEVSILNIFTWTGLIGVILYFFVFLKASYLAVVKSNSFFMKLLGLFVAFRWVYAFIEDFSNFNLYYIFLWIMIGMCFSKEFREMNDEEIKYWVEGLFKKKPVS
jgi:hypothetical protein